MQLILNSKILVYKSKIFKIFLFYVTLKTPPTIIEPFFKIWKTEMIIWNGWRVIRILNTIQLMEFLSQVAFLFSEKKMLEHYHCYTYFMWWLGPVTCRCLLSLCVITAGTKLVFIRFNKAIISFEKKIWEFRYFKTNFKMLFVTIINS